jgi:hypothetical protein
MGGRYWPAVKEFFERWAGFGSARLEREKENWPERKPSSRAITPTAGSSA